MLGSAAILWDVNNLLVLPFQFINKWNQCHVMRTRPVCLNINSRAADIYKCLITCYPSEEISGVLKCEMKTRLGPAMPTPTFKSQTDSGKYQNEEKHISNKFLSNRNNLITQIPTTVIRFRSKLYFWLVDPQYKINKGCP